MTIRVSPSAENVPGVSGQSGKFLTTDGKNLSWGNVTTIPANSSATVATSQTLTTTSYTDLSTVGPQVTLTTGTRALVVVISQGAHSSQYGRCFMDFAISGATTRSADDTTALIIQAPSANQPFRAASATIITLTAGSNTFTAKYKASGSTATFANREIIVINLP